MHRSMLVVVLALAAIAMVGIVTHAQIVPSRVSCLHGNPERQADRVRRDQAVALMKALTASEREALQQTRSFKPLAELAGLPATPDGFRLRMFVNDAGYVASLKDERDPCYFGIFSDESGFAYINSPITAPFVASASQGR
jgi:hypothetical protein